MNCISLMSNEKVISREYQIENGYIGQLTKKIHEYDSCIQVRYLYKPQEQPSSQLFLSPGYHDVFRQLL